MKRFIVFSCFLLIVFFAKAQKFSKNYLGEDFKPYKGMLFKFDETHIGNPIHTFYMSMEYVQKIYDNRVAYPDTKYNFTTVKDSLYKRIFKVTDIVNKSGGEYKSETYLEKPIFVLQDTTSKQFLYYVYDPRYEHNFPFLTPPIKFNVAEYCAKLEREVDDFDGKITIRMPFTTETKAYAIKVISKTRTAYYLSLETNGSTLTVGETGAIILFTDGTKLTKQVKIDVDSGKDGWDYSAFITLTPTDLITLGTKTIKKFRLYIHDEDVQSVEAEKFKIYFNCLKKAK